MNVTVYGPVAPVGVTADVIFETPLAASTASMFVSIALPKVVPYTIAAIAAFLPLTDNVGAAADAEIVAVEVQRVTAVHFAVKVAVPPLAVIEINGTSENATTVKVVLPVIAILSRPSDTSSYPAAAKAALIAAITFAAPETAVNERASLSPSLLVMVIAETVFAAVYVVVYSQVLAVSPQQGESAVSIFKMLAAF